MTSNLLLQTAVRTALSVWATIMLATGLSTEPTPPTPEPVAADTAPTVVYEGLAGDQERWEWAAGQFEAAGLTLENLEVRFATDPEPCKGNAGLHISGEGTHLVLICTTNEAHRRATMVHELAHVWAAQNIDQATRAEFMAERGVTVWHDRDVEWHEQGTEHAAEIITWGIADHGCWVLPRAIIGDRDLDVLAATYELLTGQTARCDTESVAPNPQRERQLSSVE